MLAVPFAASYSAYAEEISVSASGVDVKSEGDYEYIIQADGTASIYAYKGNGGNITLPSKLGGKKVTKVEESVFDMNSSITGVNIPDTITELGDDCFAWTDIEKLVLPESVTTAANAFAGCEKLKSVDIRCKNMPEMYFTFWGCDSLTNVTVPGTVKKLTCAFASSAGLEKATLKDGVEKIGYRCFGDCEKLKEVAIPASVTSISDNAFENSPNVTIGQL